jgi:hypothetical protein
MGTPALFGSGSAAGLTTVSRRSAARARPPCRTRMAPSDERLAGALRSLNDRALVLPGAQGIASGARARTQGTQRQWPPAADRQCSGHGARRPARGAPHLERPASPGQPHRRPRRTPRMGRAALLLDAAPLHGGQRHGAAPAHSGTQGRRGAAGAGGQELRSRVRQWPMASRLSLRLAQDHRARNQLGQALALGHHR